MPNSGVPLNQREGRANHALTLLLRYGGIAALLNLVLSVLAVNRYHHNLSATDHALARVLFAAIVLNLSGTLVLAGFAWRERWENRLGSTLLADLTISLLPFVMATLRNSQKARNFRLFALVYVIFLLSKLAVWFKYAARNTPGSGRISAMPVFVFLTTLLVFGAVAPWMSMASAPQGDEAHLLLLTHSIVFDHDLDVGDNYSKGDFRGMFPPPIPGAFRGYSYTQMDHDNMEYVPREPHVITNYRGQVMSEHDMGFPLLLVPGYAIDLREGGLFTLSLIGALGAAAVFEIAILLGAGNWQALLTVALFCFITPYWVFTQAVLLDLVGAVGLLWAALQFFRYREHERDRYLLLAGVLIALLPWLNIRYWSLAGPLFLTLTAWVIHREWGNWGPVVRKLAWLSSPSIVGLAVFAVVDKVLFDMYLPNASLLILSRSLHHFKNQPIRGFLGMMFDQSYGLIPTAPLYVAAAAGMVVLFRRDRWGFAALFLPALGYLPVVSSSQFWFGGWFPPGRYIFPVAMLMAPSAALVLNRKTRWLVAILAAWSLFISVLFTVNPHLRMPSLWVLYQLSMLVEFFHDQLHTPIYSILSIFPNFMRDWGRDYLRGCFWLIALIATAWWWSTTAEQRSPAARR